MDPKCVQGCLDLEAWKSLEKETSGGNRVTLERQPVKAEEVRYFQARRSWRGKFLQKSERKISASPEEKWEAAFDDRCL